jgi:multiple sugar transport system permease protein/putative spermidine/putrescine transport system permease protein
LPLLVTLTWSLVDPQSGWFAPDIVPPSLSLAHWADRLADQNFTGSIFDSLFIAICVMVLSGVVALPTAYALAKIPFRGKRAVELFVLAPLIVPGIVVGIELGVLFLRLGLSYSYVGVVLAQATGTLPLMIRVLTAALESVPDDVLHAGRTLGAGPLQLAWFVVIPLIWPGFVAGGLLSFIGSIQEFDKTFIVGAPFIRTLTVELWNFLGGRLMRLPNAAVVAMVLVLPSVLVFFLAERFMKEQALAAGMGKL